MTLPFILSLIFLTLHVSMKSGKILLSGDLNNKQKTVEVDGPCPQILRHLALNRVTLYKQVECLVCHSYIAMISSKPTVWVNTYEDEDPEMGLKQHLQEVVREHFELVRYADVKADPHLADKVQGVILLPRHSLFHEQLPLMKNLKVNETNHNTSGKVQYVEILYAHNYTC